MNRFESITKPLMWFMALLLAALAAGCGGGGQGPILGGDGAADPAVAAAAAAAAAAIAPGAICTVAAGPTIPTVTATDPTNLNLLATTSTGTAGGNKLITATFSLPMNAATITSTTFTLTKLDAAGAIVAVVAQPAPPTYNASTNVATLTVPALLPGTNYKAIITTAVTSVGPPATPLSCNYAWTFKTVTPAAAGLAPVNLGRASTFGIAATAGVTNTPLVTAMHIEGDVVLDPTATCNAVPAPGGVGTAGFGACGVPGAPTLVGTVVTPASLPAGTSTGVKADLLAAFLSITPPAGPPAAGSLGGATAIAAPTTLGALTGSALVVGQNLFYPGVYQSITSILITNDLTLDAQGNPDAVFVFQSSSTIGTAAGAAPPGVRTRILLVNGAKASNVWWQAGTSATLGAYSEFQGNILASASITMVTGATSCGRLLAGAFTAGAFVFDNNIVSVPGQPFAPPATYSPICL